MNKKTILIFLTLSLTPLFTLFAQQNVLKMDDNETTKKMTTLLHLMNGFYVDTLNMPEITEKIIINTLKELDPHSSYIPKEEVERANEPLEGSFEGVGLTFQLYKDTILVVAPIPGGPSDKVGVQAGDKIIKVDGKIAYGEDVDNKWVMDNLRGEKGTEVIVEVHRKGVNNLIDFKITRDQIPINSLDASFMLDEHTGYIKLNRFSRNSQEEFDEAIAQLKQEGMENLVFDLRGNSGGYLGTAMSISDEFLSDDKLIVYTEGIHTPRQNLDATTQGNFEKGKLVVLINEGSASASEIVAGAIQDWDRGVIIGRRSFGKGLVQRPFRMPDGSMIRLTIARYYTPSGRCIQKPYEDGAEEYYKDFRNRYEHGELVTADSISFPDSLRYETHDGRTVYGGGGIMPDIFIPLDSARFNDLYSDLIRKGVYNSYVNDYLDNNRKSLLKKYKSLEEFKSKYSISDEEFDVFLSQAAEEIEIDSDQLYPNTTFIKTQVKALIARNLYDNAAYFEVMWPEDKEINKALEVLGKEMAYDSFGASMKDQ